MEWYYYALIIYTLLNTYLAGFWDGGKGINETTWHRILWISVLVLFGGILYGIAVLVKLENEN